MIALKSLFRVFTFSIWTLISSVYSSDSSEESTNGRSSNSQYIASSTSSNNQYPSNRYQSTSSSNNSSSSRNRYRSSYYAYSEYNPVHSFSTCSDSVVVVTSLYVVCDSPYTFYYGNGANRNSPVCNYGDKLSMQVTFNVIDDIEDNENIFVTMAIYDDQKTLLISLDPIYLCEDFVGYNCTSSGSYGFNTRLKIPYPYETVENDHFYPQVQMAFSTKADSGYNLGAMNVQCKTWSNNVSVDWSKDKLERAPISTLLINYGLLGATCAMMLFVALFVWRRAADRIENYDEDSAKKRERLMSDL